MKYMITVYEPDVERRDHPTLKYQTQRTVARFRSKPDAIAAARGLLDTHAEVTIWQDKNGGRAVEGWLPAQIIEWSDPTPRGVERNASSSLTRRRIDKHYYDYEAANGRRFRVTFETLPGEAPHVPRYATTAALQCFMYQHQCWDCAGTGWYEGDRTSRESCHTCGGSGERQHREAA